MGCVACHATGAANAPKLDDKAAWEPRAATGFAALMNSVTKGKGAMPPRGGLASLSDADVENAVRYMLKEAGVEAGG
jgi:cytochrome c5